MTDPNNRPTVPYRPWAFWLLRLLLVPIGGAAAGMVYGLYLQMSTGRLVSVGRNFGPASGTTTFADSPVWFSVLLVLNAAMALALVVGTLALARLAFRRRPDR